MKRLGIAIQTMTRLPLKKQFFVVGQDYAASVAWFPVTSLLVGVVMLLVYWIFSFTGISLLAAFVSVIGAYLFTGGFHIDGFADMCDAFFARKSKERTLEILKDSRMGTYGVLAIVFMVGIKTILVANLNYHVLLILLAAPVCGKIPMVLCAKLSKYPRKDGLAKYIVDDITTQTALIAIFVSSAIVLMCVGFFAGTVAIAAMLVIGALMFALSNNKIGGATGDILGASNEIGEMVFLFIAMCMV
ncbi:MAG: adenosylcobinamide-GDP ribazoletransferase [Christensenellaceae bacterium]